MFEGSPIPMEELVSQSEKDKETQKPFAFDREKMREFGFSERKVKGHEAAQQIMDGVRHHEERYVTTFRAGTTDPDNPSETLSQDKIKINDFMLRKDWPELCADLPNLAKDSMWIFKALAENRLSGEPKFGQTESLIVMDFPEFDPEDDVEKQTAITESTRNVLKLLFGKEDPTMISRAEIDQALESPVATAFIGELLGPGQNPDDYELRLMRYDEYVRVAGASGYGKKPLSTHFQETCVEDHCTYGLTGGESGQGGAAQIGYRDLKSQNSDVAVRLVLSRKSST